MRLLSVSDLHYTLPQWDWLLEVAGNFDVVAVAGDLLDLGSGVPREVQARVVEKYLARIAAVGPLLVCSGNHDWFGETGAAAWLNRMRFEGLRTDGGSCAVGDHFFSVLGWWEAEESRHALEEQLERQAGEVGDRRWIWIYHPPPRGSRVAWTGSEDNGDRFLGSWIARHRPWLVLTGHVHNAPFVEGGAWVDAVDDTRVLNNGKQPGQVPTMSVIDLETGRAVWASAEDARQARLLGTLREEEFDGEAV